MKTITVLSFVAVISTICACKKSGSDSSETTRTQLLTQKAWIQIAGRVKLTGGDWYDNFSSKAPCEKDDQYVWKSDGSYNYNNGFTKCDQSEPQIGAEGTWIFTANETIITKDPESPNSTDLNIIQLDNSTLVYQFISSGGTVEYTMTHP